jgi:hypothetical protein
VLEPDAERRPLFVSADRARDDVLVDPVLVDGLRRAVEARRELDPAVPERLLPVVLADRVPDDPVPVDELRLPEVARRALEPAPPERLPLARLLSSSAFFATSTSRHSLELSPAPFPAPSSGKQNASCRRAGRLHDLVAYASRTRCSFASGALNAATRLVERP